MRGFGAVPPTSATISLDPREQRPGRFGTVSCPECGAGQVADIGGAQEGRREQIPKQAARLLGVDHSGGSGDCRRSVRSWTDDLSGERLLHRPDDACWASEVGGKT